MAEYIEREALLKDIGETVLFTVRENAKLPTAEMRGANKVIDRIKSTPTADVQEVVRCKDCKHAFINENHEHKPLICCLTKMCGTVDANWYCADGEKKG